MTPLGFVLLAFAAFRITRLIVEDAILDRPRGWFHSKFPYEGMHSTAKTKRGSSSWVNSSTPFWVATKGTFLGDLTSCGWCVGVWVSAGLVAAHRFGGRIADYGILAAAVAGAQAVLMMKGGQ